MKKIDFSLEVTFHISALGFQVDDATYESLETLMEKLDGRMSDETSDDELMPAMTYLNCVDVNDAHSWEYNLTHLEESNE